MHYLLQNPPDRNLSPHTYPFPLLTATIMSACKEYNNDTLIMSSGKEYNNACIDRLIIQLRTCDCQQCERKEQQQQKQQKYVTSKEITLCWKKRDVTMHVARYDIKQLFCKNNPEDSLKILGETTRYE